MDDKISEFQQALVKRYKFLKTLKFSGYQPGDGFNQGEVALTMMDQDGVVVDFLCSGVRNLEVRTGPYDVINIVGLNVEDMRDDQWPDIQFRVTSEDDTTYLSFYCLHIRLV